MKNQILHKKAKLNRIFPKSTSYRKHYFFGYYDKSPWSKNEKDILGLRVGFIDRYPTEKDKAEILLKNIETGKIKKIDETSTWSWQQGCMLQWLGPDFKSKIIFNLRDKKNERFVSKIIDIGKKEEKIIDYPIYAVSPDGKKALSLNFSRIYDVRKSYGYPGIKDAFKKNKYPKNDGIYIIDLEKNKSKLIISLDDLKNHKYLESMENGKHWVDHIGISPDGKRACFFHRWHINSELFHTRLFTIDLYGKNLFMFPDSGFYSHFFWKNNKELFGFCSISEKFGNIRKNTKKSKMILKKILPLYRKLIPKSIRKKILPVGYHILEDKTKKSIKLSKINNEDGHGTWFKNRYLITDTYPDKKHYRTLLFYDLKLNKRTKLGKFYTIPNKEHLSKENYDNFDTSGLRCDLHPRWDRNGTKICFDSVHEGFREVYDLDIRKILEK